MNGGHEAPDRAKCEDPWACAELHNLIYNACIRNSSTGKAKGIFYSAARSYIASLRNSLCLTRRLCFPLIATVSKYFDFLNMSYTLMFKGGGNHQNPHYFFDADWLGSQLHNLGYCRKCRFFLWELLSKSLQLSNTLGYEFNKSYIASASVLPILLSAESQVLYLAHGSIKSYI